MFNNVSVFIITQLYTGQTVPKTRTWDKSILLWNQTTACVCFFPIMNCSRGSEATGKFSLFQLCFSDLF